MDIQFLNQETFGPVVGVMPFETNNKILELANDTQFRLGSYIFKNNHKRIERFTEELEFAKVQISCLIYATYLPFGQSKNSSIGHDYYHLALKDNLIEKRVLTAL